MICARRCWLSSPTSTALWPSRSSGPIKASHSVSDLIHTGLTSAGCTSLSSSPLMRSVPHSRFTRHGRDQLPHVGAEMRAAAARARLPAPEQAPALSVPAHDRVGRDKGQMRAPAVTPSASQDPQELVPEVKPSTRPGAIGPSQDRKLVAREQVLQHEVLARANAGQDCFG